MLKTLIQLAFIIINISIAVYQAHRFDAEQKRINHTVWLLIYLALVSVSWPIHHDQYLIYAITVMHLPLFNTALNYFRAPRRPLFYTHPEDPQGSIVDRVWGEVYPAVFFASLICFLTIQIFVYGKT